MPGVIVIRLISRVVCENNLGSVVPFIHQYTQVRELPVLVLCICLYKVTLGPCTGASLEIPTQVS